VERQPARGEREAPAADAGKREGGTWEAGGDRSGSAGRPRGCAAKCWGVTQKIRLTTLTQERVLSTFQYRVRAQRDCDFLCK
jgi:hypothetical protein